MRIFKKKGHQKSAMRVQVNCPKTGCSFSSTEAYLMQKHIDWKHPELKQEVK